MLENSTQLIYTKDKQPIFELHTRKTAKTTSI